MTLTQILQKIRAAFYTKSQIDSMGGGNSLDTTIRSKANTNHNHDDRYYTESEINTKLNSKANDSDVVHKSGEETISGNKYFADARLYLKHGNNTGVSIFSDNEGGNVRLTDANGNYHYEFDTVVNQYLRLYGGNANSELIGGFCFFPNGDLQPAKGALQNLGSDQYKWNNVSTVSINGKTPDLIEAQGGGYIRYVNGIQICWTLNEITSTSTGSWSYPATFINVPRVWWQAIGNNTVHLDAVNCGEVSSSRAVFIPTRYNLTFNSIGPAPYGVIGLAIGRWKK